MNEDEAVEMPFSSETVVMNSSNFQILVSKLSSNNFFETVKSALFSP